MFNKANNSQNIIFEFIISKFLSIEYQIFFLDFFNEI